MPTVERREIRMMIRGFLAEQPASAFSAPPPAARTSILPPECLDELPALARRLARRFTGGKNWINRDDIESAALKGGTDAYYQYDPSRGASWPTYRNNVMNWAARNFMRNSGKSGDVRIRRESVLGTIRFGERDLRCAGSCDGEMAYSERNTEETNGPCEDDIDAWDWRMVVAALPDATDRFILTKRFWYQDTLKQIAGALGPGWSEPKVWRRIQEVSATIRRQIEEPPCAA